MAPDIAFKVVVIGDCGVGKTSLVKRYTDNLFSDGAATIAFDYKTKVINIHDISISLQIWDTTGQERFRTVTSSFYQGANGIILMYDIADESSFNNIHHWNVESERFSSGNAVKILIANKADMSLKRKVQTSTGEGMSKNLNVPFYEVSAKTSANVSDAFTTLVEQMIDKKHPELLCSDPLTRKNSVVFGIRRKTRHARCNLL